MNNLMVIGIIICIIGFIVGTIICNSRRKKNLHRKLKLQWGKKRIEKRNFELIQSYNNVAKKDKYFQQLDKQTCKDLSMDDVFSFLDRTTSKTGQQYLFHKLRSINKSIIELKKFNDLVYFFQKNEDARLKIQLILHSLKSKSAYYIPELFEESSLKKPKWFWLVPALSLIPFLLLIFSFSHPFAFILFILSILVNFILHYRNKQNIYFYSESFPQLNKLLIVAENICSFKLSDTNYNLIRKQLKHLKIIRNKMFFINFENIIKSEFLVLFYALIEIIKSIFLIELIFLFGTLKSIKNNQDRLIRVFEFVGNIDSAISIASVREEIGNYCIPEFIVSNKKMKISNAWHPLVDNCVPNNVMIKDKGMLITGSNMSGKTTFIRSIALNALFAQTIFTCFAEKYVAPFMKIYSSITIEDDILAGKSYYLEEVERICLLLKNSNSNEPCLFIIDEVFRGTNTIERIAAAKGILNFLNKKNDIVLASTHDVELIHYLKDNYEMYHFEETVNNDTLLFDHKLKNGPLKTRNAIRILEMYNYPKEVINEANDIIENE